MTDSISSPTDTALSIPVPTLNDTLSAGVEGVVRVQHVGYSSWISVNIIVITLLLFIVVYRERQYLSTRLRDFFSPDTRFIFSRPNAGVYKFHVSAILLLVACSSIGLIASGLSSQNPSVFSNFGEAGSLGFAMKVLWYSLLYVVFKCLAYLVINWVFFKSDENVRWLSSYLFITSAMAFILFPSALVQLFVGLPLKIMTICSLIMFILYEIAVFYKLLINFKTNNHGYLLIFLYLCTVELLPAILLAKNLS